MHLSGNKKILRQKHKLGRSHPCISKVGNLCCKLIEDTNTFHSNNTQWKYRIQHNFNCHSKNLIYLGYCILCIKKQYVGKTEPTTNLRINNHRKDCKNPKGIPFDEHFNTPNHDFNKHARIILIEQVSTTLISKKTITQILEEREDFWMQELRTIQPIGLNIQLNLAAKNQICSWLVHYLNIYSAITVSNDLTSLIAQHKYEQAQCTKDGYGRNMLFYNSEQHLLAFIPSFTLYIRYRTSERR